MAVVRMLIEEVRIDGGVQRTRPVAEWVLPDTPVPIEMSFTQLATPDTTKVCTYRITLVR